MWSFVLCSLHGVWRLWQTLGDAYSFALASLVEMLHFFPLWWSPPTPADVLQRHLQMAPNTNKNCPGHVCLVVAEPRVSLQHIARLVIWAAASGAHTVSLWDRNGLLWQQLSQRPSESNDDTFAVDTAHPRRRRPRRRQHEAVTYARSVEGSSNQGLSAGGGESAESASASVSATTSTTTTATVCTMAAAAMECKCGAAGKGNGVFQSILAQEAALFTRGIGGQGRRRMPKEKKGGCSSSSSSSSLDSLGCSSSSRLPRVILERPGGHAETSEIRTTFDASRETLGGQNLDPAAVASPLHCRVRVLPCGDGRASVARAVRQVCECTENGQDPPTLNVESFGDMIESRLTEPDGKLCRIFIFVLQHFFTLFLKLLVHFNAMFFKIFFPPSQ